MYSRIRPPARLLSRQVIPELTLEMGSNDRFSSALCVSQSEKNPDGGVVFEIAAITKKQIYVNFLYFCRICEGSVS